MKNRIFSKKNKASMDENSLLKNAANGDQGAFAILYEKYHQKIFIFINGMLNSKEDSEEIVQDIFINLWENKEKLIKIRSLNSYLYRTAKNRLINLHEHRKVQQRAIKYLKSDQQNFARAADEKLIYKQYERVFLDALKLLPPKRKVVFEMRVYKELSNDEIASELQISKSMVKKQLYAATKHVKEYLFQNSGIIASVPYFLLFFVQM